MQIGATTGTDSSFSVDVVRLDMRAMLVPRLVARLMQFVLILREPRSLIFYLHFISCLEISTLTLLFLSITTCSVARSTMLGYSALAKPA